MKLLIEEVFQAVFDARKEAFRATQRLGEVFHVYMTVEFYRDCMREIKGAVSESVMEFHRDNKVMGCPVFLVVESIGGERHAPWRVVKVSGLTSGESSDEIARLRAELEAAKNQAPKSGEIRRALGEFNDESAAALVCVSKLKHAFIQQRADLESARVEIERLGGAAGVYRHGLVAVEYLIKNSGGVYGMHLNGDCSPWDELRTGGRFEAWLADFDAAIDAARGGK